ncbi:MAG: cupin domain-containing protein [Deltaproteobacteria bacterium]|nr:cupin domain-containing protein [Deltaproteobacteria bacterium]
METIDLNALKKFSPEGPVKQFLQDTPEMKMALLCMEAGQEIPPHGAPARVMMQVLDGEGEFTLGNKKRKGIAGNLLLCNPDEPHGVRAVTRLTVLAVVAPNPGH